MFSALNINALPERILRHRYVLSTMVIVAALVLGSGVSQLETTRSHEIYFAKDASELLDFEALQNTFVKDENVLIVLESDKGTIFGERELNLVWRMTEEAWKIPYSFRVDSISNFQYSFAVPDGIRVENLYKPNFDQGFNSANRIERIREIALSEPSLRNRLVSESGDVAAVNVHISLPEVDTKNETAEVVQAVRNLIEKYEKEYPDVKFYLTGRIMMNNAFSEAAIYDFKILFPVTLLVIILGIVICYRSFLAGFATLIVIVVSNLAALGFAGNNGIYISPPTSTAPIIVMLISVATCVHLLHGFWKELGNDVTSFEAVLRSLRLHLKPVVVSNLTTILCFCSLLVSSVPPFRELGLLVIVGVTVSSISSLVILPTIFCRYRHQSPRKALLHSSQFSGLVFYIIKKKRILVILAAITLPASLFGLASNSLNDVFLNYFDRKVEFRKHSDFVVDNLTGLYTLEYSIEAADGAKITNPDFMYELDQLVNWLRGLKEVRHVATFTDVMKRLNKNLHEDLPEMYTLPEAYEKASQILLLYELSLPYGLDFNDRISIDQTKTRVTVAINTLSSVEVQNLEGQINNWIVSNTKTLATAGATGTTMMFANIGQNNTRSMLVSIGIALTLVSFVIMIFFESFAFGVISLLPNLFPALVAFGVWGIFVGEVGLALSVVTSMTLGVIVDDTVHLLHAFKRHYEKSGHLLESIRSSHEEVGPAIVTTSIAIICGFLFLSISSFEVNAAMGLMTAIVIFVALILDIFILPLILVWFFSRKLKEH